MAKKPGGFGWVLVVDGKKHSEGNGFIRRADNNDAELEAALIGLKEVQKLYNTKRKNIFNQFPDYEITLCSDSKIVLNWVKGTHVFKKEGKYKRFEGLKELVKLMNVQTKWIRAHAGTEHNERCDELAHQGRLNLSSND